MKSNLKTHFFILKFEERTSKYNVGFVVIYIPEVMVLEKFTNIQTYFIKQSITNISFSSHLCSRRRHQRRVDKDPRGSARQHQPQTGHCARNVPKVTGNTCKQL